MRDNQWKKINDNHTYTACSTLNAVGGLKKGANAI